MRLAESRRELEDAKETIRLAIQVSEEQKTAIERIAADRSTSRTKLREAIDDVDAQALPEVIDRIERLKLIQKFLVNILTNLHRLKEGQLKDLRPNQWKGLRAFINFLKSADGTDLIGYFKQPTGAGKTIFFGVLAKLLAVRTLILVPRNALLMQTKQELVEMLGFKEEEIGIIGDGYNETGRLVTVATYQSHMSRMKKKNKPEQIGNNYRTWVKGAELVICDEGHRSLGKNTRRSLAAIKDTDDEEIGSELEPEITEADEKYQKLVLEKLNEYISPHAMTVGVSATPRLADKSMDAHFKHLIAEELFGDLVKAGILAKFKIVRADGEISEEETKGKMTEEKEEKIVGREQMAKKLLGKYVEVRDKLAEKNERLFGVAFCPSIAECDRFVKETYDLGISCEIVTTREKNMYSEENHLPKKSRKGLVKMAEARLLRGERDLIVTVDMLTEGWNCRPPNCAIMNRITYSEARAIQGPGRVARQFPGKEYAYIFEGEWNVRGNPAPDIDKDADDPKHTAGRHKRKKPSAKKQAFGRKPLTLAAALHGYGEDIHQVCEGLNGEVIEYETNYIVGQEGEIEINNISGVAIHAYAEFNTWNAKALENAVVKVGLQPFARAKRHNKIVDIYKKEEVDNLGLIQYYKNKIDTLGEVPMADKIGVGLSAFAEARGLISSVLHKKVASAKLKTIGKAGSGLKTVDVYDKAEVEEIEYVKRASNSLNDMGEVRRSDNKTGIGILKFSSAVGSSPPTLQGAIDAAGLSPIGKAWSGNKLIDIYDKDEVMKLECMRKVAMYKELDGDGQIKIGVKKGVGINKYRSVLGIDSYSRVMQEIKEKRLKPIGKARNHGIVVDVYDKAEIDNLNIVKLTSK